MLCDIRYPYKYHLCILIESWRERSKLSPCVCYCLWVKLWGGHLSWPLPMGLCCRLKFLEMVPELTLFQSTVNMVYHALCWSGLCSSMALEHLLFILGWVFSHSAKFSSLYAANSGGSSVDCFASTGCNDPIVDANITDARTCCIGDGFSYMEGGSCETCNGMAGSILHTQQIIVKLVLLTNVIYYLHDVAAKYGLHVTCLFLSSVHGFTVTSLTVSESGTPTNLIVMNGIKGTRLPIIFINSLAAVDMTASTSHKTVTVCTRSYV